MINKPQIILIKLITSKQNAKFKYLTILFPDQKYDGQKVISP